MYFRNANRLFFASKRFLSTSNLCVKNEIAIKLNNKLSHPQFHTFFYHFLHEQGFQKNISKDSIFNFNQCLNEYKELFEIITNVNQHNDDTDFINLVSEEALQYLERLKSIQNTMLSQAIVDDADVSECTFEVRAGVGGKEASLFSDELVKLYLKYFTYNQWEIRFDKDQFEQIDIDDSSSLQTFTFEISGIQSYKFLRHEAGIHRVQRIPKTEKYGRLHTSTVSISVIPIRKNLIIIKDSDLKFEVKNSNGAGGQNVNRNLTCVRCTHIPTGLVSESQETRYQHLNKDIAIRKIEAIVNQQEFDRLERNARKQRKVQIGIASRSDKIRTYNFPQNRITDHRLGSVGMLHNIEAYMTGAQFNKMRAIAEKLEETRRNELVQQLQSVIESDFQKKFH